jgi:type IV secretion system protein VirB5
MSKEDKIKKTAFASSFLNAKQERLEQFGSVAKSASHRRLFALMLAIVLLPFVAGNILQSQQCKIVPYIVAVDKVQGKAVAVSRADVAGETQKRVIQSDIADLIRNWRTVTADRELQQSNARPSCRIPVRLRAGNGQDLA